MVLTKICCPDEVKKALLSSDRSAKAMLWKLVGLSLLEFSTIWVQSRLLCNHLSELMPTLLTWVSYEFAGFNKLITGIGAAHTEHWLDITTMRFSGLEALDGDEAVDHAVQVVEEGQQVEGKLYPALPLQEIKLEYNIIWNGLHSVTPGTCSRCLRSWWRWDRRDQLQTSQVGSCTYYSA